MIIVNLERYRAFSALLAKDDPPELQRRGFRVTYEGAKDRFEKWFHTHVEYYSRVLEERDPSDA